MQISVDIDGVIAKPIIKTKNKLGNIIQKYLSFGGIDVFIQKILYYPKPVLPNSINAIKLLKRNSFRIILNSSRPGELRGLTKKWLIKNGLYHMVEDVYLRDGKLDPSKSKYEYINEHRIKVHIDDDPQTIEELSKQEDIDHLIYISDSDNNFKGNPKIVVRKSLQDAVPYLIELKNRIKHD